MVRLPLSINVSTKYRAGVLVKLIPLRKGTTQLSLQSGKCNRISKISTIMSD